MTPAHALGRGLGYALLALWRVARLIVLAGMCIAAGGALGLILTHCRA